MPDLRIKGVRGREILDSRGNPTVEAEVVLECGRFLSDSSMNEKELRKG